MDHDKTSPERIDPLLGIDPSHDPLAARETALSLLGDIDTLAASAMSGTGLDPRVRALIEQYPGAIDPQAFKLKLGFAMAERAVDMADNDPEEAADLLNRAVKILGSRAPSAATLAASTKNPHGFSKAILGALLYATRLSKDPKAIAAKAHELIEKIEKERAGTKPSGHGETLSHARGATMESDERDAEGDGLDPEKHEAGQIVAVHGTGHRPGAEHSADMDASPLAMLNIASKLASPAIPSIPATPATPGGKPAV